MKVPLVSFRLNDHTKACFKRRVFALPNLTLLSVIATFSLS